MPSLKTLLIEEVGTLCGKENIEIRRESDISECKLVQQIKFSRKKIFKSDGTQYIHKKRIWIPDYNNSFGGYIAISSLLWEKHLQKKCELGSADIG